jgi:hypothetical protein
MKILYYVVFPVINHIRNHREIQMFAWASCEPHISRIQFKRRTKELILSVGELHVRVSFHWKLFQWFCYELHAIAFLIWITDFSRLFVGNAEYVSCVCVYTL